MCGPKTQKHNSTVSSIDSVDSRVPQFETYPHDPKHCLFQWITNLSLALSRNIQSSMCAGICIYTKLLKMLLSSIVQTVLESQQDYFELLHLFDLVSFNTALHTCAMAGQCFVSFKWLDSVSWQRLFCPYKTKPTQVTLASRPQLHSTDVFLLVACRFILPLLGTSRIRGAGPEKNPAKLGRGAYIKKQEW